MILNFLKKILQEIFAKDFKVLQELCFPFGIQCKEFCKTLIPRQVSLKT